MYITCTNNKLFRNVCVANCANNIYTLCFLALTANTKQNSAKCKYALVGIVLLKIIHLYKDVCVITFVAPLVMHPQSMNGLRRSFLCRVKRTVPREDDTSNPISNQVFCCNSSCLHVFASLPSVAMVQLIISNAYCLSS